jgi:hypothetical protein
MNEWMNQKGGAQVGDLDIDGRMILECESLDTRETSGGLLQIGELANSTLRYDAYSLL